ncbi:Protein of unknown function [Pyronema omphalodes CBS 100304]|uniref:Uncharacterized protein n=1 Tax=Pyronema omphalodes (strain CBS 100304) TaxID=1076935 RepID=U4LSG6_PYROM|nr:Protein of unknown function [Pyronema omphalodes CBS 100304]
MDLPSTISFIGLQRSTGTEEAPNLSALSSENLLSLLMFLRTWTVTTASTGQYSTCTACGKYSTTTRLPEGMLLPRLTIEQPLKAKTRVDTRHIPRPHPQIHP